MKQYVRILLSLFVVGTVCIGLLPSSMADELNIPTVPSGFIDTKEPFVIQADDMFADDVVIVTILHQYSGLDKTYDLSDFPEVEITEILYLTSLKDPNVFYPNLDYTQYRQILCLTLKNPGRDNVIAACEALMENPMVRTAMPDVFIPVDPPVNDYLVGDVDGNGEVEVSDALLVLQHITGKITLDTTSLCRSNKEYLPEVSVDTALYILQCLTGKTTV